MRSIPPTKATRSSITIVFSWWQCIGRSFASSSHWMRVSFVSRSRIVAHLATRRPEERQRRSGPDEDSHIDPLGQLGEEVAQDDRLLAAHELRSPERGTSPSCGCASGPQPARAPSSAAPLHRRSGSRLRCRAAAKAPRWPSQFHLRRVRAPSRFGEGAGGGDARSGLRSPRRAGIQPTEAPPGDAAFRSFDSGRRSANRPRTRSVRRRRSRADTSRTSDSPASRARRRARLPCSGCSRARP